jgi:hypothetical protein
MKILLTLLATLLTVTALTSSKPGAVPRGPNHNILVTNDRRQHPVERYIRDASHQ